tara:strand:+ start:457 stop:3108 length:2652 start_codon:yes stop_codon:yes gene_type:complete
MVDYVPGTSVPLPPPDARVNNTACDYCIVGCGYRVFTWPDGVEGGARASENALGVDIPVGAGGAWISPNMHNYTLVDGVRHHVVVQPDPDSTVVNRGGNHSMRGGTLVGKVYNPDGPTSDRLKTPLMRVNGELVPVSWNDAIEVMQRVSSHVIDKHGASAWGMKTYSYNYFENTYAISKLAFRSVHTPAYAPHDKPGPGDDTPGLTDSGIIPFSASYKDWSMAEVIFLSGTDPFETKTVLFTEWMMTGTPKKLIFATPRRTQGVVWAESHGGLHLQVIPGSDTALHLAILRLIIENGWEDKNFIEKWIANSWEIDAGMGRGTRNTPVEWRTTWGKLGTDYDGYIKWLFEQDISQLERAAEITGVPEEKIRLAAEMLAKPVDGVRPRTSFALEKGNYWSNNYLNTASYAALGLICGAGNRPGQMISRLGGHQRGWKGAASYPRIQSPNKLPGRRRQEIDLDRWVESGNLRFAWVMGTLWIQAMAASDEFYKRFVELTRDNPHQITDASPEAAAEALIKRADSGGMVVVNSEIYLRAPISTELSDIVLPASGWGESDLTRANGERRLRLYEKFADPPGEAQPDWWAIAKFGRAMGYEGYDWQDSNAVFEEASKFGRNGLLNYHPLVVIAERDGIRAHDLLKRYGTTGIQTPIRLIDADLTGTARIHDSTLVLEPPQGAGVHEKWLTNFKSHSGKAVLNKAPWELFSDFYERITPKGDELWVTSGRYGEVWQSAYDDLRKPYLTNRTPEHFVEIHPDDAVERGIESGDWIEIVNDDVLIQTGGFTFVEGEAYTFTRLVEEGLIKIGSGRMTAIAVVTDVVRQGVMFTNFMWPRWPGSAANSLVHRVPDPIANRYRFKLGKGRVRKTGESEFKRSFDVTTFKSRAIG